MDGCVIQVYDSLLDADAFCGSHDCVIADYIKSGLMNMLAVLLQLLLLICSFKMWFISRS
ncbi:hypothetical protein SLEP1_g4927 [Rubroshorea leprosula]|uniref:Uncharacterized protein n=1 Tax=Rubroshorea leprosula TaxID=152421 RepID=A0AAV5HQC3_9ROSI|nr:hypothetical protein SLEP1_g4927 [Rubroshorea leprosula]